MSYIMHLALFVRGRSCWSSWGGGFTVQEGGSLSPASLAVEGDITVEANGTLTVSGGSLGGFIHILAQGGGMVVLGLSRSTATPAIESPFSTIVLIHFVYFACSYE